MCFVLCFSLFWLLCCCLIRSCFPGLLGFVLVFLCFNLSIDMNHNKMHCGFVANDEMTWETEMWKNREKGQEEDGWWQGGCLSCAFPSLPNLPLIPCFFLLSIPIFPFYYSSPLHCFHRYVLSLAHCFSERQMNHEIFAFKTGNDCWHMHSFVGGRCAQTCASSVTFCLWFVSGPVAAPKESLLLLEQTFAFSQVCHRTLETHKVILTESSCNSEAMLHLTDLMVFLIIFRVPGK